MTDLVVLAEAAAQIAVSEEEGSGPATADERILLAEVRTLAGDDRMAARPAETALVGRTVDPASTGTQFTSFERAKKRAGPAAEFAGLVKFQVGRIPHLVQTDLFARSNDATRSCGLARPTG